jgi:hypothetical protein
MAETVAAGVADGWTARVGLGHARSGEERGGEDCKDGTSASTARRNNRRKDFQAITGIGLVMIAAASHAGKLAATLVNNAERVRSAMRKTRASLEYDRNWRRPGQETGKVRYRRHNLSRPASTAREMAGSNKSAGCEESNGDDSSVNKPEAAAASGS